MDKRGWHERQREQIAGLKRKQENIRRNKLMRAEQVIQRYHDAYRAMLPNIRDVPRVEFVPSLGRYRLASADVKHTLIVSESVVVDAATNMYAIVHERNMNNDPDEPGTDAYQADKAKGYAET